MALEMPPKSFALNERKESNPQELECVSEDVARVGVRLGPRNNFSDASNRYEWIS